MGGTSEHFIPVRMGSLFARSAGAGPAIVLVHGGPDLDQGYLLPDVVGLARVARVVAYDQRGRGRSSHGPVPRHVSLASELADLHAVRRFCGPDAVTILGHSWGTILALEYALVRPAEVAGLILANPAPTSQAAMADMRERWFGGPGLVAADAALRRSDAYERGDPDATAERYRAFYRPVVAEASSLDVLHGRLLASFRRQGPQGILVARAIERQLLVETLERAEYDLTSRLGALTVPALVLSGNRDPAVRASEGLAASIPRAELRVLRDCGHFALLEARDSALDLVATWLAAE